MFELDPQLIKEQFCEDQHHITKEIVRFADDQHTLRISLNKDDAAAKGWLISLVSEGEVCRQCVCIGVKQCKRLAMYRLCMCETYTYIELNL